jgi:hypothetical protein
MFGSVPAASSSHPTSTSPAPAAIIPTNKQFFLTPPPSPNSQPPPARSSTSRMPPTTGGPHLLFPNRSSITSTATTATATTATDSIFDSPMATSSGGAWGARAPHWGDKFGSICTNVTGITVPSSGGIPSLSRSEARDVVNAMAERDVFGGEEKLTSAARTTLPAVRHEK